MRSTCTSAFIPLWAISLQPSLKANGGNSKPNRPTFTKYCGICVQPDGGSTYNMLTEYVSLLKKGSVIWNAWRKKHCDTVLDLSGLDLSGLNFHEADLSK